MVDVDRKLSDQFAFVGDTWRILHFPDPDSINPMSLQWLTMEWIEPTSKSNETRNGNEIFYFWKKVFGMVDSPALLLGPSSLIEWSDCNEHCHCFDRIIFFNFYCSHCSCNRRVGLIMYSIHVTNWKWISLISNRERAYKWCTHYRRAPLLPHKINFIFVKFSLTLF